MAEKFKVRVILAVGLSEDVHYHEFTKEGISEQDIFKKITCKDWFSYQRETIIHGKPELTTAYHEFINTKYITDICIWKEQKK